MTVNELRSVLKANNRGNPRDVLLNYDQLCTLVAEITTQSSNQSSNQNNENGTFFQKITFWKLYIFRTQQLLRIHINNIIGIIKINIPCTEGDIIFINFFFQ